MNPLALSARNYRSFAKLDLTLPSGVCAITGPNGAGKSSLVNLIELALFGTRSLGEYLSESTEGTEMEIALEFEHAGEAYRVRRGFSAKGRGKTTFDLEQWIWETHSASWQPLTRESQVATQDALEAIIGLSQETFRASAFLAQGDAAAFTEAAPRDRKRILCEVLQLDRWDWLVEGVRREVVTIRDTTTRLGIQIEEAERALDAKPGVESNIDELTHAAGRAELRHREAEAAHVQATDRLIASREIAAKLTAAREVLASRERELRNATERQTIVVAAIHAARNLPTQKAESEALAGRRESIGRDLAAAREGEKAREEHRRLVGERDRLVDEAQAERNREAALLAKATELESDPLGRCDRCEQILGLEVRERAVTSMKAEALEHHVKVKELVTAHEEIEQRRAIVAGQMETGPNAAKQAELENALRLANEAERTLATIDEKLKRVEELEAELAGIEERIPPMQAGVEGQAFLVSNLETDAPTEDLEAAVARAYSDLHEARNDVKGFEGKLLVAKAELERLVAIETRTAENRAAMSEHQAELHLLQLEERVYGRDGIPIFILENTAIPAIEVEAQRILSALGGKTAAGRIELRTQRALKSGDGLKESLDIVLYTAEGGERAYEHWSGGEKTRMNLALRLALANVLANRRGAESQVFVLDEPGDLDLAGKQALVELLREVHGRGIDKVLLVSHDSDLRDAFDESIEVELIDEKTSRVVDSAAVEVAA